MEKSFFKVFNPMTSAKRMKIPTGYTNYKDGKFPMKVFSRDRFENMWPIRVIKQERDFSFQNEWEKFIVDNSLEFRDFLIFDFDGKGTFNFKLLGINGCEKNGVGGEKKKAQRSKAGCSNATACKVRSVPGQYSANIFKSERAIQQNNPYFVAKIPEKMRNQLYIPVDVVRYYKLELPPTIIVCDIAGRKIETRVNKWNDGRVWLAGEWSNFCKWNHVEKDDRFICEFVREKCNKGIYLQIQVLSGGSSSHTNNK